MPERIICSDAIAILLGRPQNGDLRRQRQVLIGSLTFWRGSIRASRKTTASTRPRSPACCTSTYDAAGRRHCPKCQAVKRTEWLESRLARLLPVHYFHVVFTLPKCSYRFRSLLNEPLHQRRAQVRMVVETLGHPQVVLSEGIVGAGREFFRQVCALGLEGVVDKRLDSRYRAGRRTRIWIKIKPPRGVRPAR